MTKISTIQFAASLSVDFEGEIDDLVEMISAYKSEPNDDKLDKIVRQYRHLSSFLQGVDYMIDFLADGEDKDELKDLAEKQWHQSLNSYWATVMELKWSKATGSKIRINTEYDADQNKTYHLFVDGEIIIHTSKRELLYDYLKTMKRTA